MQVAQTKKTMFFCKIVETTFIIKKNGFYIVTEQHSFFFSLVYLGTALILDTQNPEISGFSTASAYKYKSNGKQK